MQPDRLAEFVHLLEERAVFRSVERLVGDVGVNLHAQRAELLDGALGLAGAGIGRGQRDLRHPAGEVVGILGADFHEAVIDDLAVLGALLRRGEGLQRRHRVGENLRVVLELVDDLEPHVEIVQRRDAAHALADVGEIAGGLAHRLGEFFRNEMRIGIDSHTGSPVVLT